MDEIILFDPESEEVHFVNTTAAAIWELCDGETDEAEMVEAICQLTGMPYELVEEDVSALLRELDAAGLITWAEEAPANPPGVLETP